MDTSPNQSLTISPNFCEASADVTLKSSDKVLFKVHSRQLAATSGAFPPIEVKPTENEVTSLEENSETLELLLCFLYPRRHPTLKSTPFELLKQVAEAAEKYEVFAAVNICKIRMESSVSTHPYDVFLYAFKHDYRELMDAAAPWLVHKPLTGFVEFLPPELMLPWMKYHEKFHQVVLASFVKFGHGPSRNPYPCVSCPQAMGLTMYNFYCFLERWSSPETLFKAVKDASTYEKDGKHRFSDIEEHLRKNLDSIPPFHTFLYPISGQENSQ